MFPPDADEVNLHKINELIKPLTEACPPGRLSCVIPAGAEGEGGARARGGADAVPDPAPGVDAAGETLGLVSFKTSNPGTSKSYGEWLLSGDVALIDPRGQRSSKCRKSILNASRLLTKRLQESRVRYKCCMVTLTYRNTNDWQPRHISSYIHLVRKYLAKRGAPLLGVWKLEMQKRGAVHYHCIFWLPKGITLPFADKQGWWKHGQSNQVWVKNAYGYAAKYIGKDEHALIPKGARMFSLLGLDALEKREIRWWNTPEYIRSAWPIEHDPVRCKGGGWLSRMTGEIKRSGWQFSGFHWLEGVKHIRFIKTPTRQHEKPDYTQATKRDQEIGMWSDLARSLQATTDRVGWLLNVERMTGSWQ